MNWQSFKSQLLSIHFIQTLYLSLFLVTPLLMFHKTSELFEFNKMLFIYTIALAIVVISLIRVSKTGNIIVQKTPFNRAILFFLLWYLMTTITSIDVHTSIFGYYGRFNGGLLSMLTYVILFFGFVANTKDEAQMFVSRLLHIGLTTAVIVILWGLPAIFGHDLTCLLFTRSFSNSCWTAEFMPAVRMFSTLGQPNWLSAYLSIQFFIGFGLLTVSLNKNSLWTKWSMTSYTICSLLIFAGLLLTRSRSGLLSTALGLAIFLVYFIRSKNGVIKLRAIRLFLIGIALLILLIKTGSTPIDQFLTPFKTASVSVSTSPNAPTESFAIRKIVWKGAISLGVKHPIFGTGPETFAYSYFNTRPKEHNLTSEWDFLYNKAHNQFLNTLATTGFIGLFLYVFLITTIFLWCLRMIGRKKGDDKIIFISLTISWLTISVTNFFGFSTSVTELYFLILPAMLFASSKRHQVWVIDAKKPKLWLLTACIVAAGGGLFLLSYFLADIHYARSISYLSQNNYSSSVIEIQKALLLKYEHVYDDKLSQTLSQQAFTLSLSGGSPQEVMAIIEKANAYNTRSLSKSPKNVLYYKTKARNNFIFFQIAKKTDYLKVALSALDKAQELAPTDPKIPYTKALFLSTWYDLKDNSRQKVATQAMIEVDRSIQLKNNYKEAYSLKANLYKKFGDRAQAKKTFQLILDKVDPTDKEAQKELNGL